MRRGYATRRFSLINLSRDALGSFDMCWWRRSTSARRSSVASRLLTTLRGRPLSWVAADRLRSERRWAIR